MKLDTGDPVQLERAARYHLGGWPTLVFLSPRGVCVKRTERLVSKETVGEILDALPKLGEAADAELVKLEQILRDCRELGATRAAHDALADFWLKHENWSEAVAPLASFVHSQGDEAPQLKQRVSRWNELIRAETSLHRFDDAIREARALAAVAMDAHLTVVAQGARVYEGFARERQGKIKEALAAYEAAIALGATTPHGKQALAAKKRIQSEELPPELEEPVKEDPAQAGTAHEHPVVLGELLPYYEDLVPGQAYVFGRGKKAVKAKDENDVTILEGGRETKLPLRATKDDVENPPGTVKSGKRVGTETLKISGIEFDCDVVEIDDTREQGAKIKEWLCPNRFPGLVRLEDKTGKRLFELTAVEGPSPPAVKKVKRPN